MIITQKKPLEEVLAMVGDAKTVAVIGCGLCASTCQTGGAPEVEAMKKTLEEAGKTVVVTDVADACCMKLGVRAQAAADDGDGFRIADHGQNLFQRLFLCNNHKM